MLLSIAHSIICTRLFRGKMHSDWFNEIDILQGRLPSSMEKKWDNVSPLRSNLIPRLWYMVFSYGTFCKCWSAGPTPQPPIWRNRVSLFVWPLTLILSGKGDPTSSYATAGIALGILEIRNNIGWHKPETTYLVWPYRENGSNATTKNYDSLKTWRKETTRPSPENLKRWNIYSHEWRRSKNGRMEQLKAMEYESWKASSEVLNSCIIYIYIYILSQRTWKDSL
jgi:hypothetical protein